MKIEREIERAAESEAQEELGEIYEFVEIGSGATFDGLTSELEIQERLDAAINRCLKQLLMVRGVKSVAAAPPSSAEAHHWAVKSRVTLKTLHGLEPAI